MIGIVNKDSSFFNVTSDDLNLTGTEMNGDILSLSITERAGGMPQGTLQFRDPRHIYSRILRTNATLNLEWGYKSNGSLIGVTDALTEDNISGSLIRRGFKGFISSPSGGGTQGGEVTYNCNFTAYGFRGDSEVTDYTDGTKKDVISAEMTKLGISTVNQVINFSMGSDKLSTTRIVRKDSTTYQFLSQKAAEWRAVFVIGFKNSGDTVGIFIDPEKLSTLKIPYLLNGYSGTSHELGYMGDVNNVISYTWTSNETENGIGANVRLELIDGQPVLKRYVAETRSITTYTLNTTRLKKAIADKAIDGAAAQAKFYKDLVSTKDFSQVKRYFDASSSQEAPQGFGYKVKANFIGNPLYSPPNRVSLVNGFPDVLGGTGVTYYFNEVTHTISRSGYMGSGEIVDAFSSSDIGQKVW